MIKVLFGLFSAGAIFALGVVVAVFALPEKLTITTGVPAAELRRSPEPPPPDRTDEVLEQVNDLRDVVRALAEALDAAGGERDAIRAEIRGASDGEPTRAALVALDRRIAALAEGLARIESRPATGTAPAPAAAVAPEEPAARTAPERTDPPAPVAGEPAAPPLAAGPPPAPRAAPAAPERRSLAALLAERKTTDVRDALSYFRLLPGYCRVGFDGSSTVHNFTARSGEVTGSLRLHLNDLADGAAGEVAVPVASLDSDNPDRDEEIHAHLGEGGHPDLLCTVLSLTAGTPGAAGALRSEARIRFTFHGVSREVIAPVTVEFNSRRLLHVKGEAKLRMSDYGIEPASKFGVISVDDEVTVWWDLHGEVDRASH
jgi:polyisoprenoid-binding protein YceI